VTDIVVRQEGGQCLLVEALTPQQIDARFTYDLKRGWRFNVGHTMPFLSPSGIALTPANHPSVFFAQRTSSNPGRKRHAGRKRDGFVLGKRGRLGAAETASFRCGPKQQASSKGRQFAKNGPVPFFGGAGIFSSLPKTDLSRFLLWWRGNWEGVV
jgi:hypothetical protein